MDTTNKKKLYFHLVAQFFIVILSILLFAFKTTVIAAMLFLGLDYNGQNYAAILVYTSIVVVLVVSFCSLCIPLLYPFVAFSTYKLIKDKPLTKFQETCLKIFRFLLIPLSIEVLLIIIWIAVMVIGSLLHV